MVKPGQKQSEKQRPALITNALVYNASRIVESPGSFSLDAFFDFCSFVEALVLYDSVSYIEASGIIPKYELSRQAHSDGLICPIVPKVSPDACRRIIDNYPNFATSLSTYTFWEKGQDTGEASGLESYLGRDLRPMAQVTATDQASGKLRITASGNFHFDRESGGNAPWPDLLPVGAGDLSDSLEWLHDLQLYPSLPDEIRATDHYIRRTLGYIFVAAINQVDYFPDSVRVPFAMAHLDRSYKALSRELYIHIASIFKTDVKTIDQSCMSITLPIPPLAGLVLTIAARLSDIPAVLHELRDELSDFRANLGEIERKIRSARSIEEKLSAIARKKALFEEVSRHHESNEIISIKEGLNFSEKIAKAAAKPLDPSSYSSALLLQPVEWIKSWWLRRPLIPLFRIDSKIRRISEYGELIERLWGVEVNADVLQIYRSHAQHIEKQFYKF